MLAEAAVGLAQSFVGLRESSANSGPEIDMWLTDVGAHPGQPWCVAFSYACYKRAAAMTGLANPHPRTAGALRTWELADVVYHQRAPSVGAVVVFRHIDMDGDPDGFGHVGIVELVHPDGDVTSIEGNTNAEGSRNGDRVARHKWAWKLGKRGRLELVGFLRFELDTTP